MADKIADARRSLERAKEAAKRRLSEIDDERQEIRASLRSLDAAIRALSVRKPTTSKPAPSNAEAKPPLDEDSSVSE